MNQGKGIYLVKTQADLDQLREGESSGPGRPKNKGANRIIQRLVDYSSLHLLPHFHRCGCHTLSVTIKF